MPAGKVTLFVGAAHGPISSKERVLVSLDGGHQYQTRANLNLGGFRVLIVDVTSLQEIIVYEYQMEYGRLSSADQTRDLTIFAK
jgi:hypothetical protein